MYGPSLCSCRSRLSKALIVTARRWAQTIAPAEADRLAPIVESLSQRYLGPDYSDPEKRGVMGQITAADIPRLDRESFPLCMHVMYQVIMSRGLKGWTKGAWWKNLDACTGNGILADRDPLQRLYTGLAFQPPP